MSTKDYSASERGGGSGDTGRMRAAILNQINSWWEVTKWENPDKADRIHEKLNEAPERFISPNPSTDYREEASRIYGKIKEEHSLRSVTDLEDISREYEERAEAYHSRKREEELGKEPENELGGAPEPKRPELDREEPAEPKEPEPKTDIPEPEPADEITPDNTPADIPAEPAKPESPSSGAEPSDMGIIRLLVVAFIAIALNPVLPDNSREPTNTEPKQQTIESYQ